MSKDIRVGEQLWALQLYGHVFTKSRKFYREKDHSDWLGTSLSDTFSRRRFFRRKSVYSTNFVLSQKTALPFKIMASPKRWFLAALAFTNTSVYRVSAKSQLRSSPVSFIEFKKTLRDERHWVSAAGQAASFNIEFSSVLTTKRLIACCLESFSLEKTGRWL